MHEDSTPSMPELPDSRLPIEMEFSIASIQDAVEFWLNQQVLSPDVRVKSVDFQQGPGQTGSFKVEVER